ncbi:site-specific integrase [Haloechinothrix sp. YIM 98757]|uniref:Site-specific integrase n=1 Tax=Haloechinothrix aidingensis TaxID=2752311 RepID=A0A838ADN0_9PSEU|nr:site-specific integrase [Haloechinothrix aidingensis]MBA0127311.1 site-specific integrase [Haloechinothrix aidingensis]
MAKRRSHGDGTLYWDEDRQRWVGAVTTGYTPAGKRIRRKVTRKTKTEAREKLRELLREASEAAHEDRRYTVADAVDGWLAYGIPGAKEVTIDNYRTLIKRHIRPHLGARKLRDLAAEDVDKWLAERANYVSTRTVRLLHSILNRAVRQAQARDKVRRNVVELCQIPQGQKGRPSKALNLDQAEAVLSASESSPLHAYIVVSLLTGARTEELRPLSWDRVDLDGDPEADPPVLPSMAVWRSVRGDTKTKGSRRTLALPNRCVTALRRQQERLSTPGAPANPHNLVFPTANGTEMDAHNVRREFRKVIKAAGLPPEQWTPRELRHSFVSLLSGSGVPLEDIARLVGHSGTRVTETVYRKEIKPVMVEGATAMDDLFPSDAASS